MNTHRMARQRRICRIMLILALSVASTIHSNAQTRTDSLPEVQIVSTKYRVPAIEQPQQVTVISGELLANTSARDLVSLLSIYGHAYLRSNGPGLASGLTQRGFGTNSFQVIRDGFTLNQPMHGQVDLALIPVSAIGSAEIASANTSSTFGSAASGGSLHIGGDWRQGWSIKHERGPWGYNESVASFTAPLGRTVFTANGGYTQSDNSFSYRMPDHADEIKRVNANLDRKWLQLGALNRGDRLSMRTNLYLHDVERGIPDPINFLGSDGYQWDDEMRLTSEIAGVDESGWSVGAQLWQSKLLYDDNWLSDVSYNRVRGASVSFNRRLHLAPEFELGSSFGLEHTSVVTNNYSDNPTRNSFNGSLHGIFNATGSLNVYPAVRLDVIEGIGSAISPSLGVNQAIVSGRFHVRSQWSYNFTSPTLNDLYWSFGGNPDLKPERAHKFDLGFHVQQGDGSTRLDWQLQGFLSRAKNGIIWQPGPADMWSPVNLQQMHGHGIENSIQISGSWGDVKMRVGSQLTWNRAYIPKPRYNNDPAVDRQLRYTPEWMLRLQTGATYKLLDFTAEISHDGKRYTSEDHSALIDPLPSYTAANFITQFRLPVSGLDPSIRLTLVNAFDARYSTIAWYPMPGRHLMASIRIGR